MRHYQSESITQKPQCDKHSLFSALGLDAETLESFQ